MKTIGIDLGGTNLRLALVEDGKILTLNSYKSNALDKEKSLSIILKDIQAFKACGALAIGIAVAGPIDPKTKKLNMATNIPLFKEFDFISYLEKESLLPVYIENDANAAGLAINLLEYPDINSLYYITHSTGIGGAYILNKQIISGYKGYAGEIGNLKISEDDYIHNHLNHGSLENRCSGTAILEIAKKEIDNNIESASEVFERARKGDEKALAIIDSMSKELALALSYIAHILNPEVIVFGGGVALQHDLYFPLLKKYFKNYVHEALKETPIVVSSLEEAGVIGASLLAIKKTEINSAFSYDKD